MPTYPFNSADDTLDINALCPEGYEYIQKLLNFPKEDNISEFPNSPVLNWEELLFRINNIDGKSETCEGEDKQKRKTEILEKLKELEDRHHCATQAEQIEKLEEQEERHQHTTQTEQETLKKLEKPEDKSQSSIQTKIISELVKNKNDLEILQQETQVKAKRLFNITLAVVIITVFLVITAILVVFFSPAAAALILPLLTNVMTGLAIGAGLLLSFLPSLALGLSSYFKFQERNELQTEINLINDQLKRFDPNNSIRDLLNNPASSSTQQPEQQSNSAPFHVDKIVQGQIYAMPSAPSANPSLARPQLFQVTTNCGAELEQEDTEKDNYNSLPTKSNTPS